MTLIEAYARLATVRREYHAATFALDLTRRRVQGDPSVLAAAEQVVKSSDLRTCWANLGLTYVIRLFAEFEAILREFLVAARPQRRRRQTAMETLMDRVAVIRTVPAEILDAAHRVREYRNGLLHGRSLKSPLTFEECKAKLNVYISYLPPRW